MCGCVVVCSCGDLQRVGAADLSAWRGVCEAGDAAHRRIARPARPHLARARRIAPRVLRPSPGLLSAPRPVRAREDAPQSCSTGTFSTAAHSFTPSLSLSSFLTPFYSHFLPIFSQFSPHFLHIFSPFSHTFLPIFSPFSPHFLTLFSQFSHTFLSALSHLSECLVTLSVHLHR